MKKLWISETQFVDVDKTDDLSSEIAVRSRSLDWMGMFGYLPDPDDVLQKLGQDLTVYRQLLTDDHVWSCYQSRKSGTLSCEWEIRESKAGSVRQNRQALKLVEEIMSSLDVYQIISDILDSPFYGMSPIEVTWSHGAEGTAQSENKWIPGKIAGKPPEWFVFDDDNLLRFLSKDDMIQGEEIPEHKFLLPRHHASYQNPYGERLLARCFWPVAFKRGGMKFWAIFTEKYGMPHLIGKVPPGTNETRRAALLANLVSMVQDAVAVINNDESIEIQEAAGKAASADIYKELVSVANRGVSKAILGQTLSTELEGGGSYAATLGHLDVRQDLIDQDKRLVCETFRQLFGWITELNLAPGAAAPEFVFFEEEDIKKDKAERDKAMTEQGVRFTKKYYQRTYNLEEDDFDLTEPAPSGGGSFAERRFTAEQMEMEDLADRSMDRARAAVKKLDKPIRRMIENAKSLEELKDQLFDLYSGMDDKDLEELVEDAMLTAALHGAVSAEKK